MFIYGDDLTSLKLDVFPGFDTCQAEFGEAGETGCVRLSKYCKTVVGPGAWRAETNARTVGLADLGGSRDVNGRIPRNRRRQRSQPRHNRQMEVYLLRHGSAETARAGESDSERLLTGEGEQEIRQVAAAAKLARVCPSLVLSSPYKRAIRSAEIAAELLDYSGPALTSDALLPDSSVEQVWDELRTHRDQRAVLLAGHEPLFSACSAYLLAAPDLRIDFPKAGLLRVDVDAFGLEPRGVLKWMIIPQLTV